MIGQTTALFVDAYRELNARKLFWITLGLSGLVVAAFACVGINDKGLVLLVWELEVPFLNTRVLPDKAFFYKTMFFALGFSLWLTWAATILAIISTAGLIPEFVTSGAIDLALAKPIGRLRLFITKYLAGLTFVALQVTVFTVASFFVIGVRGGAWEPKLLLAIPIVLVFFSYLYAVSALIGLVTRSTIAALLGTLLFWFVIFILQTTEAILLTQRITYEQAALILTEDAKKADAELAAAKAEAEPNETRLAQAQTKADDVQERLTNCNKSVETWNRVTAIAYAVKTILPKTGETMKLLERSLVTIEDMEFASNAQEAGGNGGNFNNRVHGVRVSQRSVSMQIEREMRDRSTFWVLGTSLAFEAAILGLCGWIFCRRDF